MRKPNTSLRGYEAPSLHITYCAFQLATGIKLTTAHRAIRGRTFAADWRRHRPASPQNLQHWTKEQPELLQAIHTGQSLVR